MYEHYHCTICANALDPKGDSTAELVTTWVIKGRSVKVEERTWKFAHKVCIEYAGVREQISLF